MPIAPDPTAAAAAAPIGLYISFPGNNYSTNGTNKPDCSLAAGIANVVTVENARIQWYDKSGNLQSDQSLNAFFGLPNSTEISDSRVVYDNVNNRFVLESDGYSNSSFINIAVSKDSNPNDGWNFATIDTSLTINGQDTWADFPGLATDGKAIYITAAMRSFFPYGVPNANDLFEESHLWVINDGVGTGGLYDGGAVQVSDFNANTVTGGRYSYFGQPAEVLSPSGTAAGTFLVNASNTGGAIQIIRIDNPTTVPSFQLQTVMGAASSDSFQISTSQPGTNATIVSATTGNAVWQNGILYVVSTVQPTSGPDIGVATVQWDKIDTSNLAALTLADQGTIGGSVMGAGAGVGTFSPNISADANGDFLVTFSASGPNLYAGSYYALHVAGDASGTIEAPQVLYLGSGPFALADSNGTVRWGNYNGGLDPVTGNTFWVFGEYAAPLSAGQTGNWGTQIGAVSVGPTVAQASTLSDFGWAQGWQSTAFTRTLVADQVQHDAIYVGFGAIGTVMAWGVPGGASPSFAEFGTASVPIADFGTNQGYDASRARGVAVYGTGSSNGVSYQQNIVYGQGNAGIYFYRPISATKEPDGVVVPTYETTPELYGDFGANQGWNPHYTVEIAVTTHATPDIIGFGYTGMIVAPQAFAPGAHSSQEYYAANSAALGNAAGWDSLNDIRTIVDQNGKPIDLNGDGIPDVVGMGPSGLVYAYGSQDANGNYQLGPLQTAHVNGSASAFGDADGWNNAMTPRIVTDLNGDGRPDIIGFGTAGAWVALGQDPATHGGEPFGQIYLGVAGFGLEQGWSSATPRLVGDVNGDGIPDIVGFGAGTTFTDLGSVNAAGQVTWAPDPNATIADFGYAQGWDGTTFRGLADVSGSGQADLVLSGAAGTQVWHYS